MAVTRRPAIPKRPRWSDTVLAELQGIAEVRGLTYRDIAARSGVALSHVHGVFAGRNEPTVGVAMALAGACGYELRITLWRKPRPTRGAKRRG
jgi:transcriptional regulator with XRE-family HTH domain